MKPDRWPAGAANPFEILANVLLAAAYVFVATRFGLLAVTAAQFALFMTEFYPFTTDFTAWYAGATLFALGVVAALAAYAFHTALAGQPLVPHRILEG